MRYLVSGATGFIGGRVVRQLHDAGHEVVALVRDPGRARQLDDLGVRLVAGQLADRESLEAAMRGVDGVFHLAGWYHIGARDKRPAHRTNVEGTRQVLQAMRDLGIRRGAYASTLAVNSDTRGRLVDESYRYEGRHLSVYDQTKAEAYRLAEEFIAPDLPLPPIVPPWVLKLLAAVMTLGERLLPVPDAFTAEGLRVVAGTTYIGDNTRARHELGWEPRSLQEGLRETLAHEMRLLGSQGSSA